MPAGLEPEFSKYQPSIFSTIHTFLILELSFVVNVFEFQLRWNFNLETKYLSICNDKILNSFSIYRTEQFQYLQNLTVSVSPELNSCSIYWTEQFQYLQNLTVSVSPELNSCSIYRTEHFLQFCRTEQFLEFL